MEGASRPPMRKEAHVKRSPDRSERDMPAEPDLGATSARTKESDIDQILADSFPASDAPPWTLGVNADAADTRSHHKKAPRRSR